MGNIHDRPDDLNFSIVNLIFLNLPNHIQYYTAC